MSINTLNPKRPLNCERLVDGLFISRIMVRPLYVRIKKPFPFTPRVDVFTGMCMFMCRGVNNNTASRLLSRLEMLKVKCQSLLSGGAIQYCFDVVFFMNFHIQWRLLNFRCIDERAVNANVLFKKIVVNATFLTGLVFYLRGK